MEGVRKVEIFKDNVWSEIKFIELKKGDIFRLFESDGEKAHESDKLIATSDAYMDTPEGEEKAIPKIDAEGYNG